MTVDRAHALNGIHARLEDAEVLSAARGDRAGARERGHRERDGMTEELRGDQGASKASHRRILP